MNDEVLFTPCAHCGQVKQPARSTLLNFLRIQRKNGWSNFKLAEYLNNRGIIPRGADFWHPKTVENVMSGKLRVLASNLPIDTTNDV